MAAIGASLLRIYSAGRTGRSGSDANTVTGSFTTDSSFDIFNYDIAVTGTSSAADVAYTDADSNVFLSSSHDAIVFYETFLGPGVALQLGSPLPSGGGSPINVVSGVSRVVFSAAARQTLQSGRNHRSAFSVPEPSTVFLCIPAILGSAFFRRRKAAAGQAVS